MGSEGCVMMMGGYSAWDGIVRCSCSAVIRAYGPGEVHYTSLSFLIWLCWLYRTNDDMLRWLSNVVKTFFSMVVQPTASKTSVSTSSA